MKDGAQRFLLLHHPMNDHRPVFSGKTVFGVFWLWSPFASNRRRANVICSVVSEQVLHLEIQGASRSKQEGENWRQRTRNPSVPVAYLCIFLVIIVRMFFQILISPNNTLQE
jgi:hypothetical protein